MFLQVQSNSGITAAANVGENNRAWSQTPLTSLVISGRTTRGKAALMEAVQKKGQEPPRHRHPETDETFYVIEGQMTFSVEGETISAPAGTCIFIERGQEHSFTVETETAHTLILVMPAPAEKVPARA